MEEILKKIEEIKKQQEQLVFQDFQEETAWIIGSGIRERAVEKNYPVSICITLNRRRLFYCSMPGTAPINDDWIRRKENTVYKFHKSSYEMSLYMQLKQDEIGRRYGLDCSEYTAAGGAVPLILKNSGVVGAITVSGLTEGEDHELVAEVIKDYLLALSMERL
ncbi:MAG: heme-degrading domain-containing protein [Lacrimispora sp.]|uniref:heme-degrading domain-containing protein n=1 Tax=Lacrimispora sp. TaxID=2719234 RepID=UPI0039E42474